MTNQNAYDFLNRLTGRLSAVASGGGGSALAFNYQYNAASQRARVTLLDDGSYWLYGYDALGQLTSANKYFWDGTPYAGQQFDYAFDTIGNRTSTQAGGDQSGAGLRPASYTNNALNQIGSRGVPGYVDVMGLTMATNTVKVNGTNAYQKWEYFREQIGTNNSTAAQWVGITVTATNPANQTTVSGGVFVAKNPETFTYDLDGNLTNDGRWSYTWDAENRLVSMTSLTNAPTASKYSNAFTYDYLWRRIQKVVWTNNGSSYVAACTNKFVYDGWNVVAILDGASNPLYSFTWGTDLSGSMQGAGGVGGLLSMTAYSGTNAGTYFYCYDGNGNVAALVNAANGSVAANYEYGPFGELIRATGPMAKVNPFMFQTEFYDWETGKYYVKNRFYDPSTGRFLNRDPLGDLSFLGTEMNRDKKHRRELYLASSKPAYLFVANDPCNSFDPLGLDVYKVTTSTLFWIPLHRQIIGDDGNGGCYILEFFGKKRCWYQGIGAGGYNFIAPGMLRVSHDSKTPAEDYIKRNEFSIVDTVETTGAYFYGAGTTAQSASVDSMLAKDADTWVDDSTYIFLFHDCGTLANNFLSHARAVLKASENSVPTGPPGSDPFYGAFDGGDFSP